MNESAFVNQVIKHIYDNYTQMVFRVNTGSVVMRNGRRFSTGTPAGYSDISGTMPSGISFYIECKVKPNRATEKQITFIDKAKRHNALAGIAYSIDDVDSILNGK